jgi:hypothetical protein
MLISYIRTTAAEDWPVTIREVLMKSCPGCRGTLGSIRAFLEISVVVSSQFHRPGVTACPEKRPECRSVFLSCSRSEQGACPAESAVSRSLPVDLHGRVKFHTSGLNNVAQWRIG